MFNDYFGRAQTSRLSKGVPYHSGHVHDHVGHSYSNGLHVHVHTGWQSTISQQNGTHGIANEQHQKDILVRVLRPASTSGRSPPLEADAFGTPHHRKSAILVVHNILKSQ